MTTTTAPKKLKDTIEVTEVENEGFITLVGQIVTLYCLNYIYTGRLTGVSDKFVKLSEASIVYETGPYTEPNWKDAQKLPNDTYVMTGVIEMFTVLK